MRPLRCAWLVLLATVCACEPPSHKPAAPPPGTRTLPVLDGLPAVDVRKTGISIDGKLIAPGADARAAGEPAPIEAVARALQSRPLPSSVAASAARVMRLELEPDVPAWLVASVIESSAGSAFEGASIRAPRGRLLVRNASPTGKWVETEMARTDLVLLAGSQRVTVVRVTGADKPEDATVEFMTAAREQPGPFQPAYEAVASFASRSCGASATDCPQRLQVHLHAPMSAGELLALLDASTPAGGRGAGDRPVQVAFVPASPGGRNQSLPLFLMQRIIGQRQPAFHACYQKATALDPRLSGRVVIKLTIDREGLVAEVKDVSAEQATAPAPGRPTANQPLADGMVRNCVVEQFKTLRFPPPPGGMLTVTWPMFFSPGKREEVSEELR